VVSPALPHDELVARARRLRLVVTDVDGVLTDATVYYSAAGEELLRFSRRDGMGMELLRNADVPTVILSREDSDIVRARAKKLGLTHVFLGVRDKGAFLADVEKSLGVPRNAMAYIGDDVNDVDVLRQVALAGAPADAHDSARGLAHYVTRASGGSGAFREFADWILRLRAGERWS
jgi:3-deoxy-D-manno-octulosonate 8-phosphate phosphatase (KDO 8-P phosphatase)